MDVLIEILIHIGQDLFLDHAHHVDIEHAHDLSRPDQDHHLGDEADAAIVRDEMEEGGGEVQVIVVIVVMMIGVGVEAGAEEAEDDVKNCYIWNSSAGVGIKEVSLYD